MRGVDVGAHEGEIHGELQPAPNTGVRPGSGPRPQDSRPASLRTPDESNRALAARKRLAPTGGLETSEDGHKEQVERRQDAPHGSHWGAERSHQRVNSQSGRTH